MPCSPAKARHLLKAERAVVKSCHPFTIQLTMATGQSKQPIKLGVDPGYEHAGFSASTEKEEVFACTVKMRTDITKLLAQRRALRRARRNRKTRYRAPRFNNRVRSKHKGWLAPSVENRIAVHLSFVAKIKRLLPITEVIVESASFDLQKLQNPAISGAEYQEGPSLGQYNRRAAVLARDGYKCCCCHGKSKDPRLEVHHIESRRTGGNAFNNLVTLCSTCHAGITNGNIKPKFKRGPSFQAAAHMNIMRTKLLERLNEANPELKIGITYGYITKFERDTRGIAKSHCADAFCIAGNFAAKRLGSYIFYLQTRCHNRKIHKFKILEGGKRKLNQQKYELYGFRLFDKVSYLGQVGFIFGRRKSGYFDVRKLDGTRISASIKYKNLRLLQKRTTYLSEIRKE